jgi:hypothetical protein
MERVAYFRGRGHHHDRILRIRAAGLRIGRLGFIAFTPYVPK